MTNTAIQSETAPASMNLFARFIGILTAPRATYEAVVARPTWLGMFLLTSVIIAFGAALPMTTEAGKQAAVDQQVSGMEAFGVQVTDEQYAQFQKGTAILPYTTAASVVLGGLVAALIMAGILFAIFNAALGGDAKYKQILSVLIHGSVISAVGQLFTGPINYFRGAVGSATNLTALLPMLDDKSFAGKLAGAVDIFIIWWLIVLAIGLAVLYRRKTQPIATTLFAIYACIAVAFAFFTS
jgi:hypothetical protein